MGDDKKVDSLHEEAAKMTSMLKGKSVARVFRHRKKEVGIEFTDGARLFIDWEPNGVLDFSIEDEQDDA